MPRLHARATPSLGTVPGAIAPTAGTAMAHRQLANAPGSPHA